MQGLFAHHLQKNNNYIMGKLSALLFILSLLFGCSEIAVNDQDFTKEERSWIDDNRTIKLGFTSDYAPLLIDKPNGEIEGLYPELYSEIEKVTGIKFEIIVDEAEVLIGMLANKSIDGVLVLSDILLEELGLRPVRSLHQVFPIVYATVDNRAVISSIDDLKGSRISYQGDSLVVESSLNKLGDSVETIPKSSPLEAIFAMIQGEVDYAMVLNIQDYEIIKDSIQGVRIAYFDVEQINSLFTGIRSDLPELVHILNRSLDLIGNRKINEIMYKWVQPPFIERHAIFTSEENLWLEDNLSISVASDPFWSPVEFYSERDEFEGIAIDLMDEISSLTGLQFNYITGKSWNELIESGKRGEIDIFSCISRTEDREEFLNFTAPYLDIPISIFTTKNINYISGLSVLSDNKVGVVKGFAIEEWLRKGHPDLDIYTVEDAIDGLQKLEKGEILAFIGSRVTTNWYIRQHKFKNIKESGNTPYSNKLSIGVREENPILLSILEKSLRVISRERVEEITYNWLDEVETQPAISPEIAVIIALSLIILALTSLGTIYILKLRREVSASYHSDNSSIATKEYLFSPKLDESDKEFILKHPESEEIDYLKGIDIWHNSSSYLNGLKQFALEHSTIGEGIEVALAQEKYQEAKDISNTLKLMSGNLALVKVNNLASRVELLIKSQNYIKATLALKELKEEISRAVSVIQEWCGGEL